MTHLALPEQWSFRGTDLSTYAYMVRSADGPEVFPDLRGDNLTVPGIVGRRPQGKKADYKRVALALWVQPLTDAGVPGTTDTQQARANLDALYALLSYRGQGALVRTMPDASTRTAQAECVAVTNIEDVAGHSAFGLIADFLLSDPWFYAASGTTTHATTSSPTDFTVTNPGSVETHRLLLDFTGPISNPRLINLSLDASAGFYVECLVTVGSAKHLLIDCDAWTALNDGAQAIGSIRHSGAFEFFRLAPGANSLRVTSTTPGGQLAVTFKPSYV